MKPERFYQFLTHVIDLKRIASISDAEVFGLEDYRQGRPNTRLRDIQFGAIVVFHDPPMRQFYSVEFGKILLEPNAPFNDYALFQTALDVEYVLAESQQRKALVPEVDRFRKAWKAYQEALDHSPESA